MGKARATKAKPDPIKAHDYNLLSALHKPDSQGRTNRDKVRIYLRDSLKMRAF